MFYAPINCKFFTVVTDLVQVNDLVSLNSVSLVCLVIQCFCYRFLQEIFPTAGHSVIFERIQ